MNEWPNVLPREPAQKSVVELFRGRDLGRVSLVGEGDQVAIGNLCRHGWAEEIEATELGGDLWWRPLGADGSLVLLANDDEGSRLEVFEVLSDRLREDEVNNLGLALDVGLALRTVVGVDEHLDRHVVSVLPLADVVELLLVAFDGLVRRSSLGNHRLIDGDVGNTLLAVVFQANGVHEDHFVHSLRVLEAEHGGERAAEGMANHGHLVDVEGVEEAARVPGELSESELIVIRLTALAEANLIRGDNAVTFVRQCADGRLPSGAAEVLSVQQDGRLAVGLALGLDVHEGHLEFLALAREREHLHRERVRKVGTVEILGEGTLGNDARGLRDRRASGQQAGRDGGYQREPHNCRA